jgi:small subunit ribosomal protein S4
MIRKGKLYNKPKKSFEAGRIKEENVLVAKYGLKNKREIWKTLAKINYFRQRAKALARAPPEEQSVLLGKLNEMGLKVSSTADILDLKVENLLDRRLPTIVLKKKLADTIKQARQLVVHKKIDINDRVVNSPSYTVLVSEENSISLRQNSKKVKKEESKETEKQENSEENENQEEIK